MHAPGPTQEILDVLDREDLTAVDGCCQEENALAELVQLAILEKGYGLKELKVWVLLHNKVLDQQKGLQLVLVSLRGG